MLDVHSDSKVESSKEIMQNSDLNLLPAKPSLTC